MLPSKIGARSCGELEITNQQVSTETEHAPLRPIQHSGAASWGVCAWPRSPRPARNRHGHSGHSEHSLRRRRLSARTGGATCRRSPCRSGRLAGRKPRPTPARREYGGSTEGVRQAESAAGTAGRHGCLTGAVRVPPTPTPTPSPKPKPKPRAKPKPKPKPHLV